MSENVTTTAELIKINTKLDLLLKQNHDLDIRVTRVETEAGFIKGGFALIIMMGTAAISWAFKKVFP